MADVADDAAELVERLRSGALAAHRWTMLRPAPWPAAAECVDCGAEIPAARCLAVAGALRCTACAARAEHRPRRR